ncbi:MAG: glycosyltransferase [Bacteroidota bacterium]
MHIVHCLTHSTHGGGQAVPYLLVKNLLRYHSEIRHTVLLPSNGIFIERFRDIGIQVVEFPFDVLNPLNFFRIKTIVQNLNPDIIHSHGRGAGLYLRSISKSRLKSKRVHTHHGFHLPEKILPRLMFRLSEDFFLQNTDRVISVSDSEADVIRKTNPRSREIIKIIPNIVDRESVQDNAKRESGEDDSIAKKLDGKFVVTMIGRDDPVKNYALAFSAMKEVLESDRSMLFLLIGIGERTAQQADVFHRYPENVIILPASPNPLPLLSKSSVLLVTSKREAGAPLVMMEAACLGIPVVSVRVRGLFDAIQHERNGLCVENNSHSVAQALLRCAKEKTLMDRMSKGAMEYAMSFDTQSWCDQYYSMYTELL